MTLYIDTGEIDSLWMMISKLTSNKYPNLPLFLSVNKHFWYSQGYHFQFILKMEEEETMMIHNKTPVLKYKYGDDVKN